MTALRRFAAAMLLVSGFCRAADKPGEVVELPALIVSTSSGQRPWRYATGPGVEVLSRCDDSTVIDLVHRDERLRQLLGYVVPDDLQFRPAAPKIMVLVEPSAAMQSADLVEKFGGNSSQVGGPVPRVRVLPNLELGDVDLVVVFGIVNDRTFDAAGIVFTADHIQLLLQQRTPPLPAWYMEGFMRLIANARFTDGEIEFPAFTWVSDAASDALRSDPDAVRVLLPPMDLFAEAPKDPSALACWRSEAALLVRWSLDPGHSERREELWRFVKAEAVAGANESLLRDCFHLGAAELRDQLSDYLPEAVGKSFTLHPPVKRPSPVSIRDASGNEIGRLKAEWERLEIALVRRRAPQFASQYIALARQTLDNARRRDSTDPGVMAVAGLLDCDLGQPDQAEPFLAAAAVRGNVRPRVHVELAKRRLAEALARGDGRNPRLDYADATAVLETLQRAIAIRPPLVEEYTLTAEVWARSNARLSPAQLAFLDDGFERFPSVTALSYYGALVLANQGDFPRAVELAERGMADSNTVGGVEKFKALRDGLRKAAPHGPGQPNESAKIPATGK